MVLLRALKSTGSRCENEGKLAKNGGFIVMNEAMDIVLLTTISQHSIFSYDDVKSGYKLLKSYDKLIDATIEAPRLGISLYDACQMLQFATRLDES